MLSWLSWFFDDLFYWIALIALAGGAIAYILSFLVGFIPMLKAHALLMKVLGLVLVISGGTYVSDHHGYQRRVDEDKAEIERLNAEARAKEAELGQKLAKVNNDLKRAKNDIKTKQASINSRVDSGELRFPSSCGVQANSGSTTASGDSTNGSDADRQAIKDIVTLVSEGDTAITQLNACIDTYQKVREQINSQER